MGDTGGSQENHRQRNPQHTRQTLLRAACRLFSIHGFSSTTMRQIAEDAHVSVGLVNRYFDSKEKLFRECLREAAKGLQSINENASDKGVPGDMSALARAISQQVTSSAWGHEGDLLLLLVRASGDPGIERLRAEAFTEMASRILHSADGSHSDKGALRAQIVLAAAVGMVILRSAKAFDPLSGITSEALAEPMQDLLSAMFVPEEHLESGE